MKVILSKISLRSKLIIWYSTIFSVLLMSFALFTYLSVSSDLESNLDASLVRVSGSLDYIIKNSQSSSSNKKSTKKKKKDKFSVFIENERNRFVGPLRPVVDPDDKKLEDSKDLVWSAVYEHILLNTQSYYIQIADTNGVIVWKTQNMFRDTLPILYDYFSAKLKDANTDEEDSISLSLENSLNANNSQFSDYTVNKNKIRLIVRKTNNAIISVGYTHADIENTMQQLFSVLLFAFPFVLGVSIIGGLFLSRLSLRQIDRIARTADEITASNLSRRLEEVETKDEIGHLTKTLNKMIERLESSFKQVRRFTSDASHELRTPLTILRGELEIAIKSQKTPDEYQMIIASALEEVLRLSNVVTTLLDLSRADSGQVNMSFRYENISRLISDLTEDTEILADGKNITVTKEIENNVYVEFDTERMHQAVLNLIDNAIKYTPKDGKIKISLIKFGKTVEFRIQDSGIGISPEKSQFIFNRFYRVDEARSAEIHGTGLGLSIVQLIIEAHFGKISVESQVKKGSTFTISLPIYQKVH